MVQPRICNLCSVQVLSRGPAAPVVLTSDPDLLDHILAVAAVAGVEPDLVSDISALRAEWSAASMVVVGVDMAPRIAGLALPRRTEIYLAGGQTSRDQLSRHAEANWPLRAARTRRICRRAAFSRGRAPLQPFRTRRGDIACRAQRA